MEGNLEILVRLPNVKLGKHSFLYAGVIIMFNDLPH